MGLQQKVSQYPKLETWRVAFLREESAFYSNFGKCGALCIGDPSNSKIDTLWVQHKYWRGGVINSRVPDFCFQRHKRRGQQLQSRLQSFNLRVSPTIWTLFILSFFPCVI